MISSDNVGAIDLSQAVVLRPISFPHQKRMREVFNLCEKNHLFERSIIPTWIHAESEHTLIFEHERIPFVTLPYEWSPFMYRDAGVFLLDLLSDFSRLNLHISDIHPFNMSFHEQRFCFLDFSALAEGQITKHLLKECIRHYINPVALFSKGEWNRVSALLKFSKVKIRHKDVMGYLNPLEKVKYLKYFVEFQGAIKRKKTTQALGVLKKWLLSYDLTKNRLGWGDYYKEDVVTAFRDPQKWRSKQRVLEALLDRVQPKTVLDIAGNAGLYSCHAAARGIRTICFDHECEAVNRCYEWVCRQEVKNLVPAVVDFIAPSMKHLHAPLSCSNPIITTLPSLQMRLGKMDLIFMLALVHHLVFTWHLTFEEIINQAATFDSNYLCIEFPSENSKNIRDWLEKDVEKRFGWYGEETFIQALSLKYSILERIELKGEVQNHTKDGDSILFFCRKRG